MSDDSKPKNEFHALHFILLMVGGLSLGTGVVLLIDSFGWAGGSFNSNFELIGFSGLDNLGLLPTSNISIPLIMVGALCLVAANATAWRATDGY